MQTVDYEIRISSRARYVRIDVPFGAAPVVVVPRGVPRHVGDSFFHERRSWVARQRARQVPRLRLPRLTEAEGRARAGAEVTAIAECEARGLAVRYRRIRIADQKTRWGSCSSRGTLSFNWRLVLAPLDVLEYVVVHELCHLRVPNHSRRFWSLLDSVRPGWQDDRAWLNEYGAELLAYQPA
jgi:predicted metal-dependent hydrolase